VIYQVHVRAFQDSNADGIGDFRGLTQRLDHVRELGANAIWLLPFYPSPLRDDGYDIADYRAVHPSYGSLRDFRALLRAAHSKGIRVITELVMNHTSDEHPWFLRARHAAPGSEARNWYVWSDTPDGYADARIIFKDFETSNWAWDAVAGQYYWHRFYTHQPDLNFDHPPVRQAMFEAVDFWFGMGVDGLRLDAVPYLFEREGTNCENLPETLDFLSDLRRHVDERFQDRMLLAEANQWPEDAVAYFGDGDRCHMAFHFPLMPRMFMANRMEDRFPLVDILQQTPAIPDTAQWATFLRNHDELTLEMVTDEERDYMYRVYAEDPQARINLGIRHRLAPLLGNDRRRIELMNVLLCSLPGTPVVYYGDEIGMGDNIYLGDRNGVRTPMQWNADRNAGFSQANPQRLYLPLVSDPEYSPQAINVEAQQRMTSSLLWWTRHLLAVRRGTSALPRGDLEFLFPDNRKVLVFMRRWGEERILVVANLSRTAQFVELDLARFEGMTPVELFGPTEFPRIGSLPYFVTLGPYGYYWFRLDPPAEDDVDHTLPRLSVEGSWRDALSGRSRRSMEDALRRFLVRQRWFGSKGRRIASLEISDVLPIEDAGRSLLTLLHVAYTEGEPDTYLVPVAARPAHDEAPGPPEAATIATVDTREGEWVVFDGVHDGRVANALLETIERRRTLRGRRVRLIGTRTERFRALRGAEALASQVGHADQSNTSLVFGDRLIIKLFRRVEPGVNPDLEIGRFLTTRSGPDTAGTTAPVAGALELVTGGREPATTAILQAYVANEGDAWSYTLDALRGFLELALAAPIDDERAIARFGARRLGRQPLPDEARELLGPYLGAIRLLGERTAEMHLALGSSVDDPAFAPEPITPLYQRSLYQSMRSQAAMVTRRLRIARPDVPGVDELLERADELRSWFEAVTSSRIRGQRIRTHGDFHLGQVLYTGRDFVMIDFEGEPSRPLGERRIKRSPLRDVAGMLRSFAYAGATALRAAWADQLGAPPDALEPWVGAWQTWVSNAYLAAYLEAMSEGRLLPPSDDETARLLSAHLLDKAVYEIGYELDHRPEWVGTPVRGVLELLGHEPW
jgi:maltose alpha-D-glucosyltransferase/alpha-amylase